MTEVADHYRTARLRITELVLALDDEDLTRAVPACPGWTVHDVVSHIIGVADDAVHGRMDGVATEPWTAAQVDRGRGMSTADLLERWTEQAPVFESLPLPPQAVIDLTTHEQDIRGAVDQPGAETPMRSGSPSSCWRGAPSRWCRASASRPMARPSDRTRTMRSARCGAIATTSTGR